MFRAQWSRGKPGKLAVHVHHLPGLAGDATMPYVSMAKNPQSYCKVKPGTAAPELAQAQALHQPMLPHLQRGWSAGGAGGGRQLRAGARSALR